MKNTLIYKVCLITLSLIYISVLSNHTAMAQNPDSNTAFFTSINDIPLKPGLVELTEQSVEFDKPQGRIIESIAQIESGTNQEISRYYERALPQFGWRRTGPDSYMRSDEHLQLSFENFEGIRFMRLMIEPR